MGIVGRNSPLDDPFRKLIEHNRKLLKTKVQGKEKDIYFLFDAKKGQIEAGFPKSPSQDIQLKWEGKVLHLHPKQEQTLSPTGQLTLAVSLVAAGVARQNIPEAFQPEKHLAFADDLYYEVSVALENPSPLNEKEVQRLYKLLWEGPAAAISASQTNMVHPAVIIKNLFEVYEAIKVSSQKAIVATGGGVNGSYYIKNREGKAQFIFKPEDEDHPLGDPGRFPGGGAKREQVAYLMAKSQNASIPPTFYVEIKGQIGSLQTFVANAAPLSWINTLGNLDSVSLIDFQRLALFHGRASHGDGHLGNILVLKQPDGSYLPFGIDNGSCFGEFIESTLLIDYLHFPAMHHPISQEVATEVLNISISEAGGVLRQHGLSGLPVELMGIYTRFQQTAAKISLDLQAEGKMGITPFEILRMQSYFYREIIQGGEEEWKGMFDILFQLKEVHHLHPEQDQQTIEKLSSAFSHLQWKKAVDDIYKHVILKSLMFKS